jgi:hypothetical protein
MSVCYKCTERAVGCHTTCEKYISEQKTNEKRTAERRKLYEQESALREHRRVITKINRNLHRK